MAASSKLKELHVSLAFSSSATSVESEESEQDYSGDFHSSLQTTNEEISSKSSEILTDFSNDDVRDGECASEFIHRKLQILKENQVTTTEKSTGERKIVQKYQELHPFWLKKLEILRQQNASSQNKKHDDEHDLYTLNNTSNDKCKYGYEKSKPENEIGAFQSAYERIKFQNLRDRYRRFLASEIHCSETCKKCQKLQEDLLQNEFYASCVRKIRESCVEERLAEHIQSTSSALLIANIIEDGPKPSWSGDKIWEKLLSDQHLKSEQS